METDMKTNRRNTDHAQRPPAHTPPQSPPPPAFRSPDTAPRFANLLAEARAAVDHHGREAQARRQDAEEQLRQIRGREEMIAEKEREIAEFRAAKEREIEALRAEITRMDTAAKNANDEAVRHTQAQDNAALHAQDLETLLGTHAPAALQLAETSPTPPANTPANGTPTPGTPTNGTPAVATGSYPIPAAGTGPQPVPAQRTEGR
ncbi:hypothetical protein [Actinomadura bangladeshensis]|uniref:Uncharacterized protein n=1 Tax=Actinomadura bangladeshensis TaxID=453573 RepID=A0A6L9QAA9_9ACTN|nr:hypothetical protein [Actinomadura bangladeshensis]NEA21553.1 hypothetical protein [Actinomadura bangladeshensis]NEA22513.1 hypothetical protein [Actinomadura bangladeshensis]